MTGEPPADPRQSERRELEVVETETLEALQSIDAHVTGIASQLVGGPTAEELLEFRRVLELVRRGSFAGPLPPPEILEGYKAAYPDAPNIIFNELVEQGKHRREIERMAIDRQERRADRGQHYALVVVVLVLAVCVLAAVKHEPWLAVALFGTTLAAIVGTFVYGSRRQDSDLRGKRRALDEAAPLGSDEEESLARGDAETPEHPPLAASTTDNRPDQSR